MTTENTKESGTEVDLSITAMAFLIKAVIVIVIVGVCALLGKLFYGLTDASKESIAQAAQDECMKAHILSYRAENGAINKSTLWDYERDCDLKSEYQKQVGSIGDSNPDKLLVLSNNARQMCAAYLIESFKPHPEYKSGEKVIPKIIESEGFAVSEDKVWCFSDLVIERVYSENKVSEIKERRWFFLTKQFKVNNATEDEFNYALEKRGH